MNRAGILRCLMFGRVALVCRRRNKTHFHTLPTPTLVLCGERARRPSRAAYEAAGCLPLQADTAWAWRSSAA